MEKLLLNNSAPQPKWLTILRVILGLIILWKGFVFFKDTVAVETLLKTGGVEILSNNSQVLAFVITYFNLLGGFFITVGLFTRWMCIIQIIVITGAILFVNSKLGVSFSNSELMLSIIVLGLSILFSIKGGGTLSADEYFRSYSKAGVEPGHTEKFFE
ncbi:DoxX family protein [Ferruginibacter paludis]|uniref:DoxX family protein n=1 Tax=Ferruginibacter paludis TaxID=1310417 RepID=UPI0025B523EC|nr:DoxX family protein [Ferruginibacter paludis]MDN3657180.1 DoxX family protein [Ferruginibacter paludis]